MVSKVMSKIRHNLRKSSSQHQEHAMASNISLLHQKHVFIIFCSQNNENLCQDDKNLVKGLMMRSKSVCCCQKVRWRQNVRHDVNKCNIRHDVKQFVT